MRFSNIHIFINPTSTKEEPILYYLNNVLGALGIDWEVTVLQKGKDIERKIKKLIGKHDLFVVYGGDGTVVKVAKALIGTKTPLAIIPSGTANVTAKELGIPMDTQEAIQLIVGDPEIKKIDTGTMNGVPFIIRVNFGIMAKMVSEANREMKNSFGQLAYGISALQTLGTIIPQKFKLTIDGKKIEETGVALTVTNIGNVGVEGYSFVPEIWNDDGWMDVLFLQEASAFNMMKYVGTTLFQTESEVLKRWKCKEITIKVDQKEKFICDDSEMEAKTIEIKTFPKSLRILVPKSNLSTIPILPIL